MDTPTCVRVMIAGCVFALCSNGMTLAQHDLVAIRAFRKQYSAALEEIETHYSQIRCSADTRTISQDQPSRAHFTYAANGKSFRMVISNPQASDKVPTGTAFVRTPDDVVFHLSQFPDSKEWIVERGGLPDSVLFSLRMETFPAFCPYYIGPWRIAELLKNPDFRLISVTNSVDALGKKVHVEWECLFKERRGEQDITTRGAGWFEVRPEMKWVMTAYELGYNPGEAGFFCYRATVEYSSSSAGVPSVTAAEYWRELGPARVRDNIHVFSSVEMKHIVLPMSDFTLNSFGIGGVPMRRYWLVRSVLVLAVLLVSGVVFHFLGEWRRHRDGQAMTTSQ